MQRLDPELVHGYLYASRLHIFYSITDSQFYSILYVLQYTLSNQNMLCELMNYSYLVGPMEINQYISELMTSSSI